MATNSSKLNSSQINLRKTRPRHIIVKLLKTKKVRENLQRDKRKRVHYIETNKITVLFSLEIVQPDNNEMAHLKH